MFSFPLDMLPEIAFLNHMLVLFFKLFLRNLHTIIHIPTKSDKSSLFSTFLPKLVTSCVFDDSHSNSCEVITHCAFHFHFLDESWSWAPFHESVGHIEKRTYIGILDDFEDDVIWNPHWKQCYRFAQGVNWFAFDFLSEVLTLKKKWHGIRGRIQRFNCPPLSYFSNNC